MRVLITRPRAHPGLNSFAAGLKAAGFEPLFLPVIEIRPLEDTSLLDRALERIAGYDWVVFTSTYAVEIFWNSPALLLPFPGSLRVAAIGPKTAQALRLRGLEPDFVPDEYVAEAILPGLGDLKGRLVLLPCADLARQDLPDAISAAGGVPHGIAIYHTLPVEPDPVGLAGLKAGVDVITLTSPSIVHNFVALAHKVGLDPLDLPNHPVFACIGPITQRAARQACLPRLIVADEYTGEGLVRAIRSRLS
jgi:uroporphyrinogen III methyltransferase/synthase